MRDADLGVRDTRLISSMYGVITKLHVAAVVSKGVLYIHELCPERFLEPS
jgi:hypothetical protein